MTEGQVNDIAVLKSKTLVSPVLFFFFVLFLCLLHFIAFKEIPVVGFLVFFLVFFFFFFILK